MIGIQGIKIPNLRMERDKETGQFKVSGSYQLMSTTDVVLASQSFGHNYSETPPQLSTETLKALAAFTAGVQKDLEVQLGLASA